jgi:hypothetical protein
VVSRTSRWRWIVVTVRGNASSQYIEQRGLYGFLNTTSTQLLPSGPVILHYCFRKLRFLPHKCNVFLIPRERGAQSASFTTCGSGALWLQQLGLLDGGATLGGRATQEFYEA